MHSVERSVLVPYSVSQMFDLIADVEKYPEFMPWCGGASVSAYSTSGMRASVTISLGGIKQVFTTQNTHTYPTRIQLELVDGPFSALRGDWTFFELDTNACKVVFTLDYEFSSRTLGALVGPVFNRIASSFIDSFTKRAEEIYA